MIWDNDTWYIDDDNDNMDDNWEWSYFQTYDRDGNQDFDNDGLFDADEYLWAANPTLWDTDGDTVSDGVEVSNGTTPNDPTSYPTIMPVPTSSNVAFYLTLFILLIVGSISIGRRTIFRLWHTALSKEDGSDKFTVHNYFQCNDGFFFTFLR